MHSKTLLCYLLFQNTFQFTFTLGVIAHANVCVCAHMQIHTCILTCVCSSRGTSASTATCASIKL